MRRRQRQYVKTAQPGYQRAQKQLQSATKAIRSAARSAARTRVIAFSPQGETKYFDVSLSGNCGNSADWTASEIPATNYIQSDGTTIGAYTDAALIPSAVGAGYGQVVGSKYNLKKIRVRGEIIQPVVSDLADVLSAVGVRLVLVLDTRPNGAQAQGEEVFSDMGNANQCNYSFLAMGAGQGSRFRILADETIVLQPGPAGTDGANTLSITRNGKEFAMTWAPKQPLQVFLKANSSTPTVASPSNTNIFLLAHGTSAAAVISGVARCYYEG